MNKKQLVIAALILAISLPFNLLAASTIGDTVIIDGDAAEALLVRKDTDGGDVFVVDTSGDGTVTIANFADGIVGAYLGMKHVSETPEVGDTVAYISALGLNASDEEIEYANLFFGNSEITDGDEAGYFGFSITQEGESRLAFYAVPNAVDSTMDFTFGDIEGFGYQDVAFKMGASAEGDFSIEAGNVTLDPDGAFTLTTQTSDVNGFNLTLFHNKEDAGDQPEFNGSTIYFDGLDDGGDGDDGNPGSQTTYASLQGAVIDDEDGAELGGILLRNIFGGTMQDALAIFSDGSTSYVGAQGSDTSLALVADDGDDGDVILLPGSTGIVQINQTVAFPEEETIGAANEAASIATYLSIVESDGDGTTHTLEDGVSGQWKVFAMGDDGGGDSVITPTNFLNGTSITLDDAGDVVQLYFSATASKWVIVTNEGATIS